MCEVIEYFPTRGASDNESGATAPPDLLILDLDLPGTDGMTLLEKLKTGSTPLRRMPVFIFSSTADQETIDRAYDLGANAYLTKPDDYDDFLALLEELSEFWLVRVKQPSY